MKVQLIISSVVAGLACPGALHAGAPATRRYEAEAASHRDGIQARTEVRPDDPASGGAYLAMGSSGAIAFAVDAPESGRYTLEFRYRTGGSDEEQYLEVDGARTGPGIGFRASSGRWDDATFRVSLRAGSNEVTVLKSWGGTDFDFLDVTGPVNVPPRLHPERNTYYRSGSRQDLRLAVALEGRTLSSVRIADLGDLALAHRVETPVFDSGTERVPVRDDALSVYLPAAALDALPAGRHDVVLELSGGARLHFELEVVEAGAGRNYPLDIVSFDVDHGASVLYLLPDGTNVLFDTGQSWAFDTRVLPFLQANGIVLDELWISHHHGDHEGGRESARRAFPGLTVLDNRDARFRHGATLRIGGADFEVLNTYGDDCPVGQGCDENPNSLAMRMEYDGFVFQQQSDIYGHTQDRILRELGPDRIRAQVVQANHHFHGSISPSFLTAADASLYVVSANPVVLARGAFTQDALPALEALERTSARYRDTILSFDVGHTIIRVASGADWTYEHHAKTTLAPGDPSSALVVPLLR